MDKHRAKMIWRGEGISTPDWMLAKPADDGGDDGALALEKLGLPLFVKPSCGGSSTGSASVVDAADLAAAVYAAASEGHPALVERMIVGEEYTASVWRTKYCRSLRLPSPAGITIITPNISPKTRFLNVLVVCPKKKKNIWPLWRFVVFKRWVVAIGVGWILFWIWTVRRSFWKSTPYRHDFAQFGANGRRRRRFKF